MWRPSPVRLDRARVTKANHAQRSWEQGHDPHALPCLPRSWACFLDPWLVSSILGLFSPIIGLFSSIIGLFTSIMGLFPRSLACFTRSSACLPRSSACLPRSWACFLDPWLVSSILGLFSSIIHLDSAQPWLVFENYAASAKSVSVPVTLLFVQYVYIGGCRELIGGASRR